MSKLQPDIDIERSSAGGFRFAIVVSRWNSDFTEKLLAEAVGALNEFGATADDVRVFKVPGAFELPLASLKAAESGNYDAVIALGVVIRGDTPHFDFVAGEAASGIMQAGLKSGVPIMFGVITADNEDQVIERCGDGPANKGYEAAISAIEMVNLFREMSADQGIRGSEKTHSHVV
ncbi:MAG: 6,7-dimethyl-8-ribityllumazine synthase [Pyrinomonadaceae bacterium]